MRCICVGPPPQHLVFTVFQGKLAPFFHYFPRQGHTVISASLLLLVLVGNSQAKVGLSKIPPAHLHISRQWFFRLCTERLTKAFNGVRTVQCWNWSICRLSIHRTPIRPANLLARLPILIQWSGCHPLWFDRNLEKICPCPVATIMKSWGKCWYHHYSFVFAWLDYPRRSCCGCGCCSDCEISYILATTLQMSQSRPGIQRYHMKINHLIFPKNAQ